MKKIECTKSSSIYFFRYFKTENTYFLDVLLYNIKHIWKSTIAYNTLSPILCKTIGIASQFSPIAFLDKKINKSLEVNIPLTLVWMNSYYSQMGSDITD